MEIEAPLRTTGRDGRNTPAYPPDERRQSVVGSTEDPWRASQAWHRCRPDQRGQIYGAEKGSSLAGMEDVPSQSCRRHRRDGPVRGADSLVPAALRLADHGAWPAATAVVRRYCASNGRMDRQSAHRGLRLGANPSIPDPGSRRCIRSDIYPPRSIDRHSRPPDVATFTLAKRIRRTVDRLDPQGMPRSYRGVRRTPSAPCAAVLHGLL